MIRQAFRADEDTPLDLMAQLKADIWDTSEQREKRARVAAYELRKARQRYVRGFCLAVIVFAVVWFGGQELFR